MTIGTKYIYRADGTDVPVADGGTGASTLTDGGVLLGSGTGAISPMAVLADGEIIVGDGTTDPVAESGDTARISLGVGTTDSPTFNGLTTTGNTTLGDAAADTLTVNATVVSTVNITPTTAINALAIKTQEAAGATDGIVIVDSADAEVAAIDSDGNASFSGNITAANLAGVLAYGVRWDEDESSPTLTRLGTLANSPAAASPGNALLSVQSQMRRCVLSDAGVVQYYLKADDSYNRAGIPPSVTGTDDTGTASKLSDVGVFTGAAGEYVGRYVHDTTDDVYAMITAKDSDDVCQ